MAQKEYIERESLIKFITEGLNNPDRQKAFGFDAVVILSEVQFSTALDAVEVVRCKDCVYYEVNQNNEKEMVCKYWSDWVYTDPDGFCSRGERRDQK